MKALALAASLAILAGAAHAQTRPSTTTMTCRAASSLVMSQGAVILNTGRDTFDRFVRDASFCPYGQILKPAFVPTTDAGQCHVGWRCYDVEYQIR